MCLAGGIINGAIIEELFNTWILVNLNIMVEALCWGHLPIPGCWQASYFWYLCYHHRTVYLLLTEAYPDPQLACKLILAGVS